MMSMKSGLSFEVVKDIFGCEEGYQTPKLSTRAAVFKDDKILLAHEKDGLWVLPGGWCDVLESVSSNAVKEVKEETGLDVISNKIIALQDRNKHNKPVYSFNICNIFVLCDLVGGEFVSNAETDEIGFFSLDDLPPLSLDKTTFEQIKMCYDAYKDNNWVVLYD